MKAYVLPLLTMDTMKNMFDGEVRPLYPGPRGLGEVLADWRSGKKWRNVVLEHEVSSNEARLEAIPTDLDQRVVSALKARGIEQLYSHQAEAHGLVSTGKDVVIATPTASGRS